MKKVMYVLAAVALVAAVSTSCKKTCICTTYEANTVVKKEEVELDGKKKCADLNTVINVANVGRHGVECK